MKSRGHLALFVMTLCFIACVKPSLSATASTAFQVRNREAPLDACILLDTWAGFLADRGLARKISFEEAKDALVRAEEAGLVHTVNDAVRSPFICNCWPCT